MTAPSNRWIVHSNEVLYAHPGFGAVTSGDIAELKRRAAASPRGRCRICLHENSAEPLHEMVVAMAGWVYDRPHRHLSKAESQVVLEGEATCIRYTPAGQPKASQRFSAEGGADGARVLRMPAREFHGLLIHSEWFVFSESTLGPFDPNASEDAPWSPRADDREAVERYLAELKSWVGAR
jgi:cupin fold WbuC family metalloprotein